MAGSSRRKRQMATHLSLRLVRRIRLCTGSSELWSEEVSARSCLEAVTTAAFAHKPSTAAFWTQALGAPAKVVPVVDAQRFHAHIAGRGYTARAGTASVSIAAADLPGGTWKRYAHGVSRATPFGHETITL